MRKSKNIGFWQQGFKKLAIFANFSLNLLTIVNKYAIIPPYLKLKEKQMKYILLKRSFASGKGNHMTFSRCWSLEMKAKGETNESGILAV